jgi:hypothetical protein
LSKRTDSTLQHTISKGSSRKQWQTCTNDGATARLTCTASGTRHKDISPNGRHGTDGIPDWSLNLVHSRQRKPKIPTWHQSRWNTKKDDWWSVNPWDSGQ